MAHGREFKSKPTFFVVQVMTGMIRQAEQRQAVDYGDIAGDLGMDVRQ